MTVSPVTQAILLLTLRFQERGSEEVEPLTTAEWRKLVSLLQEQGEDPAYLLGGDLGKVFSGGQDNGKITEGRLKNLLGRGIAFGISMERWQRAGIWVLNKSDSEYPKKLRSKLGARAPSILFGSGDTKLLNQDRGLAVVGSRNAVDKSCTNEIQESAESLRSSVTSAEFNDRLKDYRDLQDQFISKLEAFSSDIAFAKEIGSSAAKQDMHICSGCAKGIDEAGMLGALENGGKSIGVVPSNLFRTTTSKMYRNHIADGRLVLVSSVSPETRFSAWNAHERNKHIYCLSDAAVVVCSKKGKGGTWQGASENLKNKWVRLWVRNTDDADSGNTELERKGAIRLSEDFMQDLTKLIPTANEDSTEPTADLDNSQATSQQSFLNS